MSEAGATMVWGVSPGMSSAEAALYGAFIAGAFTLLGGNLAVMSGTHSGT